MKKKIIIILSILVIIIALTLIYIQYAIWYIKDPKNILSSSDITPKSAEELNLISTTHSNKTKYVYKNGITTINNYSSGCYGKHESTYLLFFGIPIKVKEESKRW